MAEAEAARRSNESRAVTSWIRGLSWRDQVSFQALKRELCEAYARIDHVLAAIGVPRRGGCAAPTTSRDGNHWSQVRSDEVGQPAHGDDGPLDLSLRLQRVLQLLGRRVLALRDVLRVARELIQGCALVDTLNLSRTALLAALSSFSVFVIRFILANAMRFGSRFQPIQV
jgi:hypothetical protein